MPAADTMTMQKWPDTLNLATKFYRRCVWHIFAIDSRIIFKAKVVPRHLNRRLIGKMSHSIFAVVTLLCLSSNWKDIRSCYILCLPSNAGLDLRLRDFLTFFASSFHTLLLFLATLFSFADFRQIYNVSTVESTKWDGLSRLWGQGWSRGEKEW